MILLNTLGKIYRKCAVSSGALAERQELHISVKRAKRTQARSSQSLSAGQLPAAQPPWHGEPGGAAGSLQAKSLGRPASSSQATVPRGTRRRRRLAPAKIPVNFPWTASFQSKSLPRRQNERREILIFNFLNI